MDTPFWNFENSLFTVIWMKWPVSENFSTSPYEIMTCRSNVGFVILEFLSLFNTRQQVNAANVGLLHIEFYILSMTDNWGGEQSLSWTHWTLGFRDNYNRLHSIRKYFGSILQRLPLYVLISEFYFYDWSWPLLGSSLSAYVHEKHKLIGDC